MSLQVWLPLNGDLRNQGLNNMTFSNTNTTNIVEDSNGKLGKCYKRTTKQTAGRIISNTTINLSADFSMCCWAKVTDCISSANGLVSNHSHADNTGFGITVREISTTDYRISCNTGSGSDRTYNTYYGTSNIKDAWHHLAITYDKDNTQLKLWVDGICENTIIYNGVSKADYIILFDWSTTYDSYQYRPAVAMNDVRIYDHALSPLEVKHLAQGLVLHYPLNRGGFGGDNLLVNTDFSGVSKKYTLNSGSEGGLWFPPTSWERNTEYTLSCRLRGNANMNLYLISSSGNQALSWVNRGDLSTTDYRFFSITFTSKSDRDVSNLYICTRYGTSNSSVGDWFEIAPNSLKFEKGATATPWIPNLADPLYTSLGLDDGVEYDVSGYGHNGTKYGTLTYSSDTPRYNTSAVFNGTDNCIQFPFNDFCVNGDIFTMNIWWKKTELGSKSYETLIGGPSGFEMDTRSGAAQALSLYMTSTRGGNVYSPFNMNEWYMVTLVNDGTNELYYVNGTLVKTIEKKNMPSGNYYVGAWSNKTSQNFKGFMSDFRFYKTALSPDDVMALYKNAGYVDSDGNVYAYEMAE